MSIALFYALVGVGLFCLGFYALTVRRHLLLKILAINVMGSGIFLLLVALGKRGADIPPDPVPHAMVITGIVVAVSNTALALSLMLRVYTSSGRAELSTRDEG
jgi:multicomponent Na+:H+ antiporter subunit C